MLALGVLALRHVVCQAGGISGTMPITPHLGFSLPEWKAGVMHLAKQ